MARTEVGRGERTEVASVLYLDDTAERTAVETYVREAADRIDIETVTDLSAARSALDSESYDCLVLEPDIEGTAPETVTAAVCEGAPETPVIAYTAVDFTDLQSETLDDVTTLVQKGGAIHRRFLLEKVHAAVHETDEDTRYDELAGLFADERAGVALLGGETAETTPVFDELIPAERPGESVYDRIETAFEDGTALRERLAEAAATGEQVTGRVAKLTTGEAERYVAWWCVHLDGQAVAFYREVTDDIERRGNRETLETLVELAQDGMYTLDANARIEYCNDAFAETMGYDRDELVGRFIYELMLEDGLRKGQRLVQEAVEDPDTASRIVELPLERADGQRLWIAAQCTAISGEGGGYGGLVNVARDVTERRRRERDLEQQRERLAEKNDRLETVARVVSEEFSEPLEDALAALEATDDPSDPAVLDRIRADLETVEATVQDHLEVTRENRQDEPVVPSERAETDAEDAEDYPEPNPNWDDEDGETTTESAELRVLLVDGDDEARARLAHRIDDEPDIAVDTAASLSAVTVEDHGAVVADPETLGGDVDDVVAAVGEHVPLLAYTDRPAETISDQFGDTVAAVLGKGDSVNRAFVVEKLRSLTGIGRPDGVEVPWTSDPVERVGPATDLLVARVTGGTVTATSQQVEAVFPGLDGADLRTGLRERLANGDQYAAWVDGAQPQGTGGLLCEYPTETGCRFYRCWRWPVGDTTLEVYRDVTSEVNRSDRLERARTLVEEARDAIHVLDASGDLVYCNPALADLLGYDREELLGMDMTKPIRPEHLTRGQQAFQDLIENPDQESAVVELEITTRDEQRRTTEVNYTLTPFDEDGSYTGAMVVGRDVTERKQRERELRRQREQLQRKNELLERFASIVSHDLRNPLTVALGHVGILRERDNPESVEKVRDALTRMQEMLEELLAFARLGGEVDVDEGVDLSTMVTDAWATVDAETATLQVDLSSETVDADRAKLLHVFENLFRNSVEHSEPTDGPVTVRVGTSDEGIVVADDGPGIPAEDRDRIFEYGYSTTEGTGIGLAIAKDVIRAHGWELTVSESAEGGARFDILVRQ